MAIKIYCLNIKFRIRGSNVERGKPRSIAKKWILRELETHGKLTKKELLKLIEIKESTLNNYLSQLVKEGFIEFVRVSGKETEFYLKK